MVLENWNRDRLSPHASRRTSQGFNFALHQHASHHTHVDGLAQSLTGTALSLNGPALPAPRSLLLPNQLADLTDTLTNYCMLESLTFKLRFSFSFSLLFM